MLSPICRDAKMVHNLKSGHGLKKVVIILS
jgi:hypothetical protein